MQTSTQQQESDLPTIGPSVEPSENVTTPRNTVNTAHDWSTEQTERTDEHRETDDLVGFVRDFAQIRATHRAVAVQNTTQQPRQLQQTSERSGRPIEREKQSEKEAHHSERVVQLKAEQTHRRSAATKASQQHWSPAKFVAHSTPTLIIEQLQHTRKSKPEMRGQKLANAEGRGENSNVEAEVRVVLGEIALNEKRYERPAIKNTSDREKWIKGDTR